MVFKLHLMMNIMLGPIATTVTLLLVLRLNLLDFHALSQFTSNLQIQCLDLVQSDQPWSFIYQALVCGKKLPRSFHSQLLISSGLIHYFVISGFHLSKINSFIKSVAPKSLTVSLTLICFIALTLITNFAYSCTRTLVQYSLSLMNKYFKLNLQQSTIVLLSGVFFILICDLNTALSSYSLMLSWAASLALALNSKKSSSIKVNITIYIILLPILLNLSPQNPLTIIVNFFMGPVLAYIILPFSYIQLITHAFNPAINTFWEVIFYILKTVQPFIPPLDSIKNDKLYLWIYLMCIHLIVHLKKTISAQGKTLNLLSFSKVKSKHE